MFFRRMFSRKENVTQAQLNNHDNNNNNGGDSNSSDIENGGILKHHHAQQQQQQQQQQSSRRSSADDKRSLSVLQLTPLWEHVIRTHTLPDNINLKEMFQEFLERLRDPEWQVRQHALRVLVDVLIVIGQKADTYFSPIIPQLVENLGHPAPTVRKGALDALRVYISESAMPETVLLEIMDIGFNQRITNEPFGGRLTCGVMLSLPSLIQATLHTPKRNFILRSTIDMLINKMTQVTHQEITLKVLIRIRDLIGAREFSEYMTHGAYREFELLCNVYGLNEMKYSDPSRTSWKLINSFDNDDGSESFWRFSDDGQYLDNSDSERTKTEEKVIMETEIKINDDTLTMRILESKDDEDKSPPDNCSADDENEPDDIITTSTLENTGLIQVLTDSELEEINDKTDPEYTPRTPKRVTFGGEIVKMRTPDSDTVAQSDADEISMNTKSKLENLKFLTVEIPNDNTKPIRPTSGPRPDRPHTSPLASNSDTMNSVSPVVVGTTKKRPNSEESRQKSTSPRSPFRRISISPVDDIISPKPPHKEIEVLHNLQRSPSISPTRLKRQDENDLKTSNFENKKTEEPQPTASTELKINPNVKTWEDLGLVDENVINGLRSGDWRHRSDAICSLEEALKSTENLALIQPYLDSLFRTLLSSEKNIDVAEDKRRVIINLITRLPLDNLENRTGQIITGLCRQGGAGSNRISKSLMQRLPPASIVLRLLSDDFLHARSSRFRENALQMVMYALTTFPSTYFDTSTCVTRATYAVLDRKKRVRQASLDVLAILGQVTSPRTVMDVVQNIANSREDGLELCSAVKARLARKQLPIVSPDGFVQYALRVPSPQGNDSTPISHLGADIEWITAGIGSVSPTSLKRRTQNFQITNSTQMTGKFYSDPNRINEDGQRRVKAPHEILALGVSGGTKLNDDYNNQHLGNSNNLDEARTNLQYSLTTGTPIPVSNIKISNNNGDIFGIYGQRIASRSCSDSSQDGRSSDSTSSGHNIGGRFNKLPVTSRFPAMERLDVTGVYMDRHTYRNLYDHAPHRLNSTYPKSNYSNTAHRKVKHNRNHQDALLTESSFDESPRPISHQTTTFETSQNQNPKRFMNVEKFIMQSNKQQQQQFSENIQNIHHTQQQDIVQLNEVIGKRIDITPAKFFEENLKTPLKNNEIHENLQRNDDTPKSHHDEMEKKSNSQSIPVMSEEITPISNDEVQHSRPASTRSFEIKNTTPSRPESIVSVALNEEKSNHEISRPSTAVISTKSHENISRPPSEISRKSIISENVVEDEPDKNDEIEIMELKSITPSPDLIVKIDPVVILPEEVPLKIEEEEEEEEIKEIVVEKVEPDVVETVSQIVIEEIETFQPTVVEEETIPQTSVTSLIDHQTDEVLIEDLPFDETPIHSPIKKLDNPLLDEHISRPQSTTPILPPVTPLPSTPLPAPISPPIHPIQNVEPSITKSYESIFGSPMSRPDADTKSIASTETNADYQQSRAASLDEPIPPIQSIPINYHLNEIQKQRPPPLMRKSKTTLFGRKCKVSPTKQSLKPKKTEVFSDNLGRFSRPREAMNQTISQLDSPDWETIMVGLHSLVRLIRYHPELLDTQMHSVTVQLSKSVRNLRSQVSRAACQAATEFFNIRTKSLEQECDDLCGNLLHRTADTNRFLRGDATRALESMCDNLTPSKILHILTTRGAVHQNSAVRTTTAKLLIRLADRIGCERIYNMSRENRDRFFITGANLLLEGSLETRSYAKALFRLLSEHPQYHRLLLEVIPSRTYRNIEKTLKSIR